MTPGLMKSPLKKKKKKEKNIYLQQNIFIPFSIFLKQFLPTYTYFVQLAFTQMSARLLCTVLFTHIIHQTGHGFIYCMCYRDGT